MVAQRGRSHGEEEERGRDGFKANGGVKGCLINEERKVMEGGTVCVCMRLITSRTTRNSS